MNHQPRRRSLPKATRTDSVRRQLEQDILIGRFPAGTHLDETAQAERLGCSRTPVREAFNQLVAVGLLERRNHCGVYVSGRDPGRLDELVEAYGEIEILCVSMALARLGGEARQSLASLQDDPERLWDALIDGCGNRTMAEMAQGLRAKINAVGGVASPLAGPSLGGDGQTDLAKSLAAAVLEGNHGMVADIIRHRLRRLMSHEGVAA